MVSYKAKQAVIRQQQLAAKWERDNRALMNEAAQSGFVSLDDFDIQEELGVCESNPEYLLMEEQEVDLIDLLGKVDYDEVAPSSQSLAVSRFNSFFN